MHTRQRYYKNCKVWVFCFCSSNKTDLVCFFKSIFPFCWLIFQNYFKTIQFLLSIYRILGNFTFFEYEEWFLMINSFVFITSDYVITFWYSHLHVLISELTQNKSALNERCSALKTQCFGAKKFSAEQHWSRAESLWNSADFFRSE